MDASGGYTRVARERERESAHAGVKWTFKQGVTIAVDDQPVLLLVLVMVLVQVPGGGKGNKPQLRLQAED